MEVRPQGDSFRAPRHHRVLGEVGSQCAGASAVFSATRCCSHTSLNARRTCLMHGSASVGRRSSSTRGDRVPHTGDDNDDPGGHNEALTDPARGTDGRAGKDGLQYIGATGFPALPPVQAGLERGRQDHAPSAPASMTQLDGPPVGVCTGLRRRRRRRWRQRGQMGGQRHGEMTVGSACLARSRSTGTYGGVPAAAPPSIQTSRRRSKSTTSRRARTTRKSAQVCSLGSQRKSAVSG